MESSALSVPLFAISRTLNRFPSPHHRSFSTNPLAHAFRARISSRNPIISCLFSGDLEKPKEWMFTSVAGVSLQKNSPAAMPISRRLACISSSASVLSSGGSGDGVGGGNGGGFGGGGSGGGETEGEIPVVESENVSTLSSDVIILDVSVREIGLSGMTCGGCAASVKRILESQPQVSSASVNLATETAVVWPVPEVKTTKNWQQQLGEKLAKHLTSCGFKSNLRVGGLVLDEVDYGSYNGSVRTETYSHIGAVFSSVTSMTEIIKAVPLHPEKQNLYRVFEKKMDERLNRLKESGRELAFSWALCAVCLLGHASHFFGASASWIHLCHSAMFHLSLSLFTLVGPGRRLIVDGLKSLSRGAPNMNTLVGLGALSSFAVSSIATLIPKLVFNIGYCISSECGLPP
ncbi:Copper-transporting ATPase PAA1 [Asimina triloba]